MKSLLKHSLEEGDRYISRIDLLTSDLCEEIDYWKDRAKHFENLYNKEVEENNIQAKERLQNAQQGVANMLMFALHIEEKEDGSLNLPKDKRKELVNKLKT